MYTEALDQAVQVLAAHKMRWARGSLAEKAGYLSEVVRRTVRVAPEMVAAAVAAKHIPPGPLEAEEWAGPYCIVRYANRLRDSLRRLESDGEIHIERSAMHVRPDGSLAVRVFPSNAADRILFHGFRAEVWMCPGITEENLREHTASWYRRNDPDGKVALVLGAGNVSSIGPLDVLTKMYLEGQVCLLKLSPVNDYLSPFLQECFAPFIADGFLRIVRGGAETGAYLCNHPGIEEIHITGSHLTHDAIVFGAGEEGDSRKRARAPRIRKRITSELGNVSPIVVVPGTWTTADLRAHAENIATQMINNAGFNCCASKVLVLPRQWPLSGKLMEELRDVLAHAPQRDAYYPGAEQRYERFVSSNGRSEAFGRRAGRVLPWTLIPDLDPEDRENICFRAESFCGVMGQTSIAGADARDFLRRAIAFCNDVLWGTLSGCIVIDPETRRAMGAAFEESITGFRYGSIGINHWPMLGFVLGSTTWGAFPGHSYDDIQSGIGVVHNALMFDSPERTVTYGPFRVWPKPVWYITNRQSHRILPALLKMEADPGFRNFAAVALPSLGG